MSNRLLSPGLLSTALLGAVTTLIPNILPVIFTALAADYALSETELGNLGAAFVFGMAVVVITAPRWIRSVSWPVICAVGLSAAALCLLLTASLEQVSLLIMAFFATGFFKGLAQAPTYAALADWRDPARAYSLSILIQMVLAAILVALIPALVVPLYGSAGIFLTLAGMALLVLPLLRWLPPNRFPARLAGRDNAAEPHPALFSYGVQLLPPVLAAVSGAIYLAPVLGIYYFIGGLAVANGFEESTVGALISAGIFASMFGAALPSALGNRIGTRASILLALSATIVFALPALGSSSLLLFSAGFMVYSACWGYAMPFFLSIVREVDRTHRVFSAAPALQTVGSGMGSAGAGFLIESYGYGMLFWVSAAMLVLSALLCIVAVHLHSVLEPAPAADVIA